jgi:hypothetical protein
MKRELFPFTGVVGRKTSFRVSSSLVTAGLIFCLVAASTAQQSPAPAAPPDAVAQAQQPTQVQGTRPEQNKTDHDRSTIFNPPEAKPSSPVLNDQPKQGKNSGFDFYRDPLNSDRPNQSPDEIMQQLMAAKPAVMDAQRKLLERRYTLEPKLDTEAKMSRGKPLAVGPTARLGTGVTWQPLAGMSADEIRTRDIFPYPSLPHPLQTTGGQVFPKCSFRCFHDWSEWM